MDQTELKSSEQATQEFEFYFVNRKDEKTIQAEDGSAAALKSEVVASRLKLISNGGHHDDPMTKEKLVFDLQTGQLTVEVTQPDPAKANRLVMEEMVASGWFLNDISSYRGLNETQLEDA
ncbi:hypothetical protein OS493_008255 [Desmophyllum pertusum]|uniref:Uncharacterized protein n=1 Tax=Desmophyllum pertusum TaxID=174260 RepID=A0A9X0A3Y7_9CNID|nr:hypothetical protein OS493_008255 [Desmophyllum pertusum]